MGCVETAKWMGNNGHPSRIKAVSTFHTTRRDPLPKALLRGICRILCGVATAAGLERVIVNQHKRASPLAELVTLGPRLHAIRVAMRA